MPLIFRFRHRVYSRDDHRVAEVKVAAEDSRVGAYLFPLETKENPAFAVEVIDLQPRRMSILFLILLGIIPFGSTNSDAACVGFGQNEMKEDNISMLGMLPITPVSIAVITVLFLVSDMLITLPNTSDGLIALGSIFRCQTPRGWKRVDSGRACRSYCIFFTVHLWGAFSDAVQTFYIFTYEAIYPLSLFSIPVAIMTGINTFASEGIQALRTSRDDTWYEILFGKPEDFELQDGGTATDRMIAHSLSLPFGVLAAFNDTIQNYIPMVYVLGIQNTAGRVLLYISNYSNAWGDFLYNRPFQTRMFYNLLRRIRTGNITWQDGVAASMLLFSCAFIGHALNQVTPGLIEDHPDALFFVLEASAMKTLIMTANILFSAPTSIRYTLVYANALKEFIVNKFCCPRRTRGTAAIEVVDSNAEDDKAPDIVVVPFGTHRERLATHAASQPVPYIVDAKAAGSTIQLSTNPNSLFHHDDEQGRVGAYISYEDAKAEDELEANAEPPAPSLCDRIMSCLRFR